MDKTHILTIAIPTYNMERWLEKNLATYCDEALYNRLEVLCLNNASDDSSEEIIKRFVDRYPRIFSLVDRKSRGYGGSINEAIRLATGRYFRIVDADDWVETSELVELVDTLEDCRADVVLTDYEIVNMMTEEMTPVRAGDHKIEYGRLYQSFENTIRTLPSIHGTTYRTGLLRECSFFMQDNLFFVDEEYVVLPYLAARSVIYLDCDVYRYQVANPNQSTSPQNRAKYQEHREKILKRLISEYHQAQKHDPGNMALAYCFERIHRGVGDHFTTLYMYVEDRREGRRMAAAWRAYISETAPEFSADGKRVLLSLCNLFRLKLETYQRWKALLLR